MRSGKLHRLNIMGGNNLFKFLLVLELVVTTVVAMNLSESVDRYAKTAGVRNPDGYLYERYYEIVTDYRQNDSEESDGLDDADSTDYGELDREFEELMRRLDSLPVNAYFYVGGRIGDGDVVGFSVYASMKEGLPYPLESGSYDRPETEGVFLGNGFSLYINDGYVKVFDEMLPVAGIMAGSGFYENEQAAVEYRVLSDSSKALVLDYFRYCIDSGPICPVELCIGSNDVDVSRYGDSIEEIFSGLPHLILSQGQEPEDYGDSMAGRYSWLKTFLVCLAMVLCVLSSIQVVGMYLAGKRKEIAIRYAFGLGKGLIFGQVLREMLLAALTGAAVAILLEVSVYIGILGYSAGPVFKYGGLAVCGTVILYSLMLAIAFVRVSRRDIVLELRKGRE